MKKLLLLGCLLLAQSQSTFCDSGSESHIKLSSPLLKAADNAGVFNGPILDILRTRIDVIALIKGEKEWAGSIMNLFIENLDILLTAYFRRPETIFGATFVVVTPDHKHLASLITESEKNAVNQYLATIKNKSLYERQMTATLQGAFTGSYAINPVSKELIPVFVSDYAMECFDSRQTQTRIGVPAHNSKDFEFAKHHKLPIKIVVDVPNKSNIDVALPILDKNGSLKEAYLGEYRECIIAQSDFLNDLSLKEASAAVISYLEEHNMGTAHQELLHYAFNNQNFTIKDLIKAETAILKNTTQTEFTTQQKNDLKIILNYAQADFLEIVEKFLVNVRNTRTLMIALIDESCSLRNTPHSYLLCWSRLNSNDNEKEAFRRDIHSIKELGKFCFDLVNFLEDLAHSCPKALESIKNNS